MCRDLEKNNTGIFTMLLKMFVEIEKDVRTYRRTTESLRKTIENIMVSLNFEQMINLNRILLRAASGDPPPPPRLPPEERAAGGLLRVRRQPDPGSAAGAAAASRSDSSGSHLRRFASAWATSPCALPAVFQNELTYQSKLDSLASSNYLRFNSVCHLESF